MGRFCRRPLPPGHHEAVSVSAARIEGPLIWAEAARSWITTCAGIASARLAVRVRRRSLQRCSDAMLMSAALMPESPHRPAQEATQSARSCLRRNGGDRAKPTAAPPSSSSPSSDEECASPNSWTALAASEEAGGGDRVVCCLRVPERNGLRKRRAAGEPGTESSPQIGDSIAPRALRCAVGGEPGKGIQANTVG